MKDILLYVLLILSIIIIWFIVVQMASAEVTKSYSSREEVSAVFANFKPSYEDATEIARIQRD